VEVSVNADVTALQSGVPRYGVIDEERQMAYYVFDAQAGTTTEISHVDLYVSNDSVVLPEEQVPASYVRTTAGEIAGKVVTLYSKEATQLVIGVLAGDPKVTFVLLAEALDVSETLLTVDSPLQGYVEPGVFAVYDLAVDMDGADLSRLGDVYIVVTPMSGDPDLYVNAPASYPAIPSSTSYAWRSISYFEDVVHIPHEQMTAGFYRMAVSSCEESMYTIAVHVDVVNNTADALLLDGVSQYVVMAQAETRTCVFEVAGAADSSHDITVTATPQFGDPDIYVEFGKRVNMFNYTYR